MEKMEIVDIEIISEEDFNETNNQDVYMKENGDVVVIMQTGHCMLFRKKPLGEALEPF